METDSDNASNNIVLIIMLCIFALLGSVGNGLSTFVFYKIRDKTSAQIFILSLSMIDLFTCFVIIPFTIVVEYLQHKVKYDIVCKAYHFMITSKVPLSAFMMVAIALDRYLCICHSLKRLVNPLRTKVIIACLVIFACALGIATSLGYGVYFKHTPTGPPVTYNMSEAEMLRELAMEGDIGATDDMLKMMILQANLSDLSVPDTSIQQHSTVIYTGICKPYLHGFHLDKNYITSYQIFYSLLFVVCLVVVGILYSLIYHFIKTRRTQKLNQKLVMCTYTQGEKGRECTKTVLLSTADCQSNINGREKQLITDDGESHVANNSNSKKHQRNNDEADKLRDEARAANIKTAAMLFIVNVVYILAFTPAWLIAYNVLPMQKVVFYMYFSYNVANPLIYAFMNQIFKDHLRKMFRCFR